MFIFMVPLKVWLRRCLLRQFFRKQLLRGMVKKKITVRNISQNWMVMKIVLVLHIDERFVLLSGVVNAALR